MADGTGTIFVAGLPTQIFDPCRNILCYRQRVPDWTSYLLQNLAVTISRMKQFALLIYYIYNIRSKYSTSYDVYWFVSNFEGSLANSYYFGPKRFVVPIME
jgi:hypothetical protein